MRVLAAGSAGNDVMEVQSILRRLGYEIGAPDGVFGRATRNAVILFQQRFGLSPDGVIGPATARVLEQFMLGYDVYAIRPGDSLYGIAQKYGVEPEALAVANPGVDPKNLPVGKRIVVPFGYSVVPTDIGFTFDVLRHSLQGLKARYPFLTVASAGTSVLGRDLFTLRMGTGPNRVFFNAAHHALEWITTPVLMKFAEDFLAAYASGAPLNGYHPREIWARSSIFLMPMVNPDGVDLVINGLSRENPFYDDLLQWNKGSTDFSSDWEANNRGVDLNHNYDAAWQQSKEAEAALGITGPGPTRYSGPSPVSEPETKSVVRFTKNHDFRLVIAYHSQGRVIYWNFQNLAPPEARVIGENMAQVSGYTLDEATGVASLAGYKDWFIQDYRRPGYTVEVGQGKNPLPISQFPEIYRENLGLLLYASTV